MTQFIDPKTLSRLKDLPLVAKTLAHGFLQGLHASHQRGVGIEFSQYRIYEPGDELSKVDWKLFARSDRYFVREAERESEINVWFVLDCSRSMQQSSLVENHTEVDAQDNSDWSKLTYSKYLISTMAYLAQKQGDSVGFLALSSQKSHFLPAYAGERHWQKLLIELAKVQPGGVFPKKKSVQAQLTSMKKNGLIIFLSDFYQQTDEISDLAASLANSRTDVANFHLSTQDEISFPFSGAIRFQDLETEEEVLVSAEQVKTDYLLKRAQFQTKLKIKMTQQSVQHVATNIDQPLNETLYQFLNMRNKVNG